MADEKQPFFGVDPGYETVVIPKPGPLTREHLEEAARRCREDLGRPQDIHPLILRAYSRIKFIGPKPTIVVDDRRRSS